MIRINQLKLNIAHTQSDLERKILKTLHMKKEYLQGYKIRRQSIDARKKPDLYYVYSVDVLVKDEAKIKKSIKSNQIQFQAKEDTYNFPANGTREFKHRPVIIGTGPAGLFCGYMLAIHGYRPILLERGADVDQRTKDVETFWKTGTLDPSSNVQFGEGGAGTFSDGKLNTLVKDKSGRNHEVLRIFARHGAPEAITYQSKPHIGTDILSRVVKEMRECICAHGGEVRFHSQVTDIQTVTTGNTKVLRKLEVYDLKKQEKYVLDTELAVFAIGHSARDTFAMLHQHEVPMQPKAFAVGVRMEHPQEMINKDQYGEHYPDFLPAAPYKLTANLKNGRGVYTFCMCPGGYVIPSSCQKDQLVVNGMSYASRSGENANSALLVQINDSDYGNELFAGLKYQEDLEKKAFKMGGDYKACVQLAKDYLENKISNQFESVLPTYSIGTTFCDLNDLFSKEVNLALHEALEHFEKKVPGFVSGGAILSAVESRSSSSVRLVRDKESYVSNIQGIYPSGEGSGYAGGIMTSAIDGIRSAEHLIEYFAKGEF